MIAKPGILKISRKSKKKLNFVGAPTLVFLFSIIFFLLLPKPIGF